jgi:hypothetical protein
MAGRHVARGILDVAGLVVEEEVGLELAQELALGQAAEEHGLVDLDVPVHQGADGALVRRGAARGDQRGAHAHAGAPGRSRCRRCSASSSGLKGPAGQRLRGLFALVRWKASSPAPGRPARPRR